MKPRVIPFSTMEVTIRYAQYLCSLAGAVVMFVMPNAVVIQYNGQVVMMVAREEEGG